MSLASISGQRFDLIVVGGGIAGAGVAREAALRGLTVALFERGDFAGATSSRTSKLIHGGLRYLEIGDLALVFESIRERRVLLETAPHLVRPLPFLFPIYRNGMRNRLTIQAGMWTYDALALFHSPRHEMLSARRALELEPALNPDGLIGAARYYDAQMDDARLCLQVVLSARQGGASVWNYTEARALIRREGRVTGVEVSDVDTGVTATVFGDTVVNAAGPWCERLLGWAAGRVRYVQGSHLVVPRLTREHAIVATAHDRRLFFIIPWGLETVIGTTEREFVGDPANVRCTVEEAEYLIQGTRRALTGRNVGAADVVARFAGVRTLAEERNVPLWRASREERIEENPGYVSVVGGKFTTHRAVAERVVDRIAARRGSQPARRSRTASTPILGGAVGDLERYVAHESPQAQREFGLDAESAAHIVRSYGCCYRDVLEPCRDEPLLRARLIPDLPHVHAQVRFAVKVEMARRLEDVLRRRTRLALSPFRTRPDLIHAVVATMAEAGGWDQERRGAEIQSYLKSLD